MLKSALVATLPIFTKFSLDSAGLRLGYGYAVALRAPFGPHPKLKACCSHLLPLVPSTPLRSASGLRYCGSCFAVLFVGVVRKRPFES
jgi:hypothetical protein